MLSSLPPPERRFSDPLYGGHTHAFCSEITRAEKQTMSHQAADSSRVCVLVGGTFVARINLSNNSRTLRSCLVSLYYSSAVYRAYVFTSLRTSHYSFSRNFCAWVSTVCLLGSRLLGKYARIWRSVTLFHRGLCRPDGVWSLCWQSVNLFDIR